MLRMTKTPAQRLRKARIDAGYKSATAAAAALGVNLSTYTLHENGGRAFDDEAALLYAKKFKTTPEYLLYERGAASTAPATVRIIGRVGADPSGEVVMTTAHDRWDLAPIAPGGSADDNAVEVAGHSMPWLARDGSLIYFQAQRTPPTADMLGYPVVVETEDGRILVKRLLRGSSKGLFDLESENGQTIRDVRVAWAAEITAIIPPRQARRIIIRDSDQGAA